jgi:hypothetical protein
MRKIISVLLVTASLPLASIVTPAHADGGGAFVGGLFGGLAAGTLIGIAAAGPRYYYYPPPVYVGPGSVCYLTRGRPYWDGYQGAWIYPSVRVCE